MATRGGLLRTGEASTVSGGSGGGGVRGEAAEGGRSRAESCEEEKRKTREGTTKSVPPHQQMCFSQGFDPQVAVPVTFSLPIEER